MAFIQIKTLCEFGKEILFAKSAGYQLAFQKIPVPSDSKQSTLVGARAI
jgi:hypothetical protein